MNIIYFIWHERYLQQNFCDKIPIMQLNQKGKSDDETQRTKKMNEWLDTPIVTDIKYEKLLQMKIWTYCKVWLIKLQSE